MQTFSVTNLPNRSFAFPERILVATDLNDGEYLIPHVIAQAKASHAHVTLLHAILPLESYSVDAGAIPYGAAPFVDRSQLAQEERAALLNMAARIKRHDIPCEVASIEGLAAKVIQKQITAMGADRLIMATHGRGKLGQLVLGSVTNQLLGSVTIPVFAIGPRSHHSGEHVTPRRILHPVSMTGDYKASVKLAIDIAKRYQAELTLLHIPDRDVEHSIHPGCTLSWAENLAAELIPEAKESERAIHISVAFGNKVEEIRKEAERINADWIVLGVEEGFFTWPLGESTAYKVLATANCPVLAIPPNLQLLENQHESRAHSQALAS